MLYQTMRKKMIYRNIFDVILLIVISVIISHLDTGTYIASVLVVYGIYNYLQGYYDAENP
jgi:hypothetical protein